MLMMIINGSFFQCKLTIAVLICMFFFQSSNANGATCLWVSSYHQGYEWEDGIGRGITAALAEHCKIHRFSMDTKRNPDPEFGRKKGAEAFALVQSLKPDVIIASDDNASRYFVQPFMKDAKIPVVFCGVNWTVSEYGYPYKNATGMVEFAPAKPLIREIKKIIRSPKRGLYLSSDVPTEHTDYSWYRRLFAEEGVVVDDRLVRTMESWELGYLEGQKYDFIILGPHAGINDWDHQRAKQFSLDNTGKLTITNYDWMMAYAMIAITKIPDEQGEWAGNVALAILDGVSPAVIPIVPNRHWNLFVNERLVERAGIALDRNFLLTAIKVQP